MEATPLLGDKSSAPTLEAPQTACDLRGYRVARPMTSNESGKVLFLGRMFLSPFSQSIKQKTWSALCTNERRNSGRSG